MGAYLGLFGGPGDDPTSMLQRSTAPKGSMYSYGIGVDPKVMIW